MALDDPSIPRVCKNGYRILAPLTPGMRTTLARPGVLDVEDAKPIDVPLAELAVRAAKVAGYTS